MGFKQEVHKYRSYNSAWGGVAQRVARLTRNVEVVGSSPIKGPLCFLHKKLYAYCLVLVDSRNGFARDVTIELK